MQPFVVLITGANAGLGLALAERVLQDHGNLDVTICLACRSKTKAFEAQKEILAKFPRAKLEFLELDTSEVKSVLRAAKEFKERFSRLDVMYLNAGIMPTNGIDFATIFKPDLANAIDVFTTGGNAMRQVDFVTSDGLKGIFATNIFGHFILTQELEQLMIATKKSADSLPFSGRIVWTSSRAAKPKSFSLEDYQHANGKDPYGSSKHAIDLVTRAMNKRLNASGISVYSTCPGFFMSHLTYSLMPQWIWLVAVPILFFLRLFSPIFNMTAFNGAEAGIKLLDSGRVPNPQAKHVSTIGIFGRPRSCEEKLPGTEFEAETLHDALTKLAASFRTNSS